MILTKYLPSGGRDSCVRYAGSGNASPITVVPSPMCNAPAMAPVQRPRDADVLAFGSSPITHLPNFAVGQRLVVMRSESGKILLKMFIFVMCLFVFYSCYYNTSLPNIHRSECWCHSRSEVKFDS